MAHVMKNVDTERKFLVLGPQYQAEAVRSLRMQQGYLARGGGNTVRVRTAGDRAWLTVKGPSPNGISRLEWEKEIPVADAEELLALCVGAVIDKTRWIVPVEGASPSAGKGRYFEVDEFHGDNEGLVVAEIELDSEDEKFPKPQWLGEEVTSDPRYRNARLADHPYKDGTR